MSVQIKVIKGDITQVSTDAIVNAANNSLLGGGGVDGAIHRAGGKSILAECMKIIDRQGECPTGEAVITTAGKMPSKFVIHTVGPVWRGGDQKEPQMLQNCYLSALGLAEKYQLKSIAFPNISTGVYGYPKDKAASIAVEAVTGFSFNSIKEVSFICFDEENYQYYQELLKKNGL